MSETEKIDIWSSWHVAQGDLLSTIETRNSNGALLGLGINSDVTVILKQPDDNTIACIAVTSEARNVEVYYDNGEYIGTAGRSILKNTEHDTCLLCCCTYELDRQIVISQLLLKLLSLRGKDQIKLTKISLLLMENYGGEEQENTTWCNDMMSSLAMVHDLPPFVQSIVNGLHHGSPSDEMNKLIVMLRDARIAKEDEERKQMDTEDKEVINDKKESEDRTESPLPIYPTDDDPLTALEMKLKQVITEQLTLLEQRFEAKINNLVKRLDNLESNITPRK